MRTQPARDTKGSHRPLPVEERLVDLQRKKVDEDEVDAAISTATIATTQLSGQVAIANGGTAATAAPAARTNLGLGALAVLNSIGDSDMQAKTLTNASIANQTVTNSLLAQETGPIVMGVESGSASPSALSKLEVAKMFGIPVVVDSEDGDPVRTIISNTAGWVTETAASYTIPADTLADFDVEMMILSDVLQNAGSTINHGIQLYLGGTQIYSRNSAWSLNDVDRYGLKTVINVSQRGATNKQLVSIWAHAGAGDSTGGGWIWDRHRTHILDTAAQDATTSLLLDIKHYWASAQTNGDQRVYKTRVTLIPR